VFRLPVWQQKTRLDVVPPRASDFEPGRLVDAHEREYSYLRLSVTDRCDLACVYCMPPSGEDDHALARDAMTEDEIVRLVRVFVRGGVRRVRFTGGEPLVRKDIVSIVRRVHDEGDVDELVMTTNATRLRALAAPLARAGLSGVNVSIDSLDAERFRCLTRGGDLAAVIAGIDAALGAGLDVKLNAVVLRGDNDGEARALVEWAWARGVTPRFIELMPIGEGAQLANEKHVSAAETVASLGDLLVSDTNGSERFETGLVSDTERGWVSDTGKGPARYLTAADGSGRRVGFITAVSESFCDSCNRVRVNARGELRTCLASRRAVSLRDAMRDGASDDELAWMLAWALSGKQDGHRFRDALEDEHRYVGMSLIGG
jgi:cyclic pyranopterin phosphate synthase